MSCAPDRDPLTSALVQYRRGDEIHSADVLALRWAGGWLDAAGHAEMMRGQHPIVMAHLRERPFPMLATMPERR